MSDVAPFARMKSLNIKGCTGHRLTPCTIKIIIATIVLAVAAAITVIVVLTYFNNNDSSAVSTSIGITNSTGLLALSRVAVANVTMVSAATEDASKDQCVDLGWIPTGIEWTDSSGKIISYLCMQQSVEVENGVAIDAVDLDTLSLMRRIVVVPNAKSCPTGMHMIVNSSSNAFACGEYITANIAFDTKQYVVDLMTTTESFYNHDTPGWITWPMNLKLESVATGVYLSVRYPIRPIVAVEVLTNVSSDATYSACNELLPQGEWETPGFVVKSNENAINKNDIIDVVICVQRPLANTTGTISVLTDLAVVRASESCPNVSQNANSTKITRDRIKLCAEWEIVDFGKKSNITSSFVAELSLYATSKDNASGVNISSTLPGNWNIVGNISTGTMQTFFLARKFEQFVLNTTSSNSNVTNNSTNEVSSLVNAVVSNLSEELSFKVLQIADMHLTGNPDYSCSEAPNSIRASLLATASVIAEQLKKAKNVSSTARAGEASDPMYNKCREAVTVAFLDELLDIEQPDFVVFTGDNVQPDLDTAMHAFAMNIFTTRVERREIPWAAVFGNHDGEGGLTREEMLALMIEGKQYSHVKYGPRGIGGVGNYEVSVVAPTDGPWGKQGSAVFRMYFLDSHAKIDTATYPLVNDIEDYDWVKESQIAFYRELAQSHIEQNESVPSVMYYHIPIPEYALASTKNRFGDKNEGTASAAVNCGLFSALLEVGDVKANFVGHDHINEYCYFRQGIQLCYGGGIGLGRAYGLTNFERRARVLEWTFNKNQTHTLRSWKRHLGDPTQIQSLEVLYTE